MSATMAKHPNLPADAPPTAERSAVMRSVGQKNTGPEKAVRKIVHSLGFRFRLHRKDLPGTPDLVLPRLKKVVFVHGCFWHRHEGCSRATTPKTRFEYWQAKFIRNKTRDAAALAALKEQGWKALIVWECEIKQQEVLRKRLARFLSAGTP